MPDAPELFQKHVDHDNKTDIHEQHQAAFLASASLAD